MALSGRSPRLITARKDKQRIQMRERNPSAANGESIAAIRQRIDQALAESDIEEELLEDLDDNDEE